MIETTLSLAQNANIQTNVTARRKARFSEWITKLPTGLMAVCLVVLTPLAWAIDSVRDQEIAQCLSGEMSSWGDGRDRPAISSPLLFVYRHTDSPSWFDEPLVLSSLKKATAAWSLCGVQSRVISGSVDLDSHAILVQWSEQGSRSNFGLANLTERTLSLGPSAFQMLKTRNPGFDSRQTLQMVISHEMGHMFGVMSHSRRCVDVTSNYTNAKGETCSIRGGGKLQPGVEYRSVMPTACDIQRCKIANATSTRQQ